jgi:hypothetical protein
MSWTKRQFIVQAFSEIGLSSYVPNLTPAQYQDALRKLDAMIGDWQMKAIIFDYPFTDNPDDSDLDTATNAPRMANQAIYENLSVLVSPPKGKTPSIDTKAPAKASLEALMGIYNKPVSKQLPTTMPKGQGSKYWRWSRDPFIQPEEATESTIEIV